MKVVKGDETVVEDREENKLEKEMKIEVERKYSGKNWRENFRDNERKIGERIIMIRATEIRRERQIYEGEQNCSKTNKKRKFDKFMKKSQNENRERILVKK